MRKGCGRRKGQAILEYLVIATVVIAAILAVRTAVTTNMNSLFSGAANQTKEAASVLGSLKVE